MKATWDIFCTVVDNYGDIGVTWRLARQLAAEHPFSVRLWVDDLQPFLRLCPGADSRAEQQWQEGVSVCYWSKNWRPVEPADVVIEAFACRLPPAFIEEMPRREHPPLWLNLEYLSAEEWVSGCHALPSPQPNGVRKIFFFPGFRPSTGGLLREAGLLERRHAFQRDTAAQRLFLEGLGVVPKAEARLMSLFAYENAGLASWLDALAASPRPAHLLVPEGRILGDLKGWLGVEELRAGTMATRGELTIQVLPFVRQDDYDRLLWCCDFNAVRGEDSFVRAQWAGRPMLWHIYQQDDDAHWVKLEAFLDLYLQGLSPAAAGAVKEFWRDWNGGHDMRQTWSQWLQHELEITEHAERWCLEQASRPDLTAALVQFYLNWL
jgi:uncharacterized repeat protein (TIGR03837 family)